jgi:tRNA threonylcarbamoyladenosine biosynthesis protein TsaE
MTADSSPPWPLRRTSGGAAETEALGARIAGALQPGDLVLVSGDLGSGKTTLIRGACRALGVAEPVTSPTFTIGQRYRGRVSISHLDLFRLAPDLRSDAAPEVPGLLEDYLDPDVIVFAEWPDAAAPVLDESRTSPGRTLRISIAHGGGDEREIVVAEPTKTDAPLS